MNSEETESTEVAVPEPEREPTTPEVPGVSVILGAYNHEKYIAQAIESILSQQTNFGIEVVATEDRSTDRTLAILEDYQSRNPNIITILASEVNLNSPEVFVRAIERARGRYIAYLDGDDYWTSAEKLQKQYDFMEAHPGCAIVHHAVERVTEEGEPIRVMEGFQKRASIVDLIQGNPIAGCSAMIRRSAIDPLPAWFSQLKAGDWAIYIIAARHGWVGKIDGVFGHYRIHESAGWATAPLAMQWALSLSMLDIMEVNLGSRYRAAFARSRSAMIANIREAVSEQVALNADQISLYERERLAQDRVDRAERDVAISAQRIAHLHEELVSVQREALAEHARSAARVAELHEELVGVQRAAMDMQSLAVKAHAETAAARSEVIHTQQLVAEARKDFAQQASEFQADRQLLLQSIDSIISILKRERRVFRHASVANAALSIALGIGLIASLWFGS